MKSTLKIASKGQVTFRKAILDQLGVRPGDKITVELVAPGRVVVRPAQPAAKLEGFIGLPRGNQGGNRASIWMRRRRFCRYEGRA
jgi:bifunctional DNA-binding transcriptional regulator/antitoxin component of YhaV-PrlF toxin-antitoxin module